MSEWLAVVGIGVCAASGLPGLVISRTARIGQFISCLILLAGCGIGLAGVATFWWTGHHAEILWPWPVPGAEFRVEMDGLSALFAVPVFLIAGLGSIFGLGYWRQDEHPENGRRLSLFYGLLTAGMGLLVLSRNSLLFLAGWELIGLSNFFLVTTLDQDKEVRRAGWIYLIAAHLTTLCLIAIFGLLASATGSFELRPLREGEINAPMATAIFFLGVVGFGLKAGIMPLHVWLPGAHAIAPTHVSAVMSGVVIKMGIYGLVRLTSLFPNPPFYWGAILLALGAISGVLGVAYAIGQHDLKRLLAYHSIENIGIIVMGIGLALIGRSLGRIDWIFCGMAGALLHVWNHALFKALLFLGAGSVIHATRTREIDHLGGLAKVMPYTAFCFLAGAVAICGLPPLNGFVSEFLIFLGLFRTLEFDGGLSLVLVALAVPALALVGALAVACFVKVVGAVFLGAPRMPLAREAHESGPSMVGPMLVLVACCFLIGLAPFLVSEILLSSVQAWAAEVAGSNLATSDIVPWGWLAAVGWILLFGIVVAGLALRSRMLGKLLDSQPTWGCGYAAPTPRMQYTSSSFAQMLVDLFAWALRPKRQRPSALPLFPRSARFRSEVADVVLEDGVLPAFRFSAGMLGWFRILQQGSIQLYLMYIFLTLLVLFCWPTN